MTAGDRLVCALLYVAALAASGQAAALGVRARRVGAAARLTTREVTGWALALTVLGGAYLVAAAIRALPTGGEG